MQFCRYLSLALTFLVSAVAFCYRKFRCEGCGGGQCLKCVSDQGRGGVLQLLRENHNELQDDLQASRVSENLYYYKHIHSSTVHDLKPHFQRCIFFFYLLFIHQDSLEILNVEQCLFCQRFQIQSESLDDSAYQFQPLLFSESFCLVFVCKNVLHFSPFYSKCLLCKLLQYRLCKSGNQ